MNFLFKNKDEKRPQFEEPSLYYMKMINKYIRGEMYYEFF